MDDPRGVLHYIICLGVLLPRIVGSKQAATVRMLVRDQVQVLNPGQTLEIPCEFYMEDFDMFENPIIWKKTQITEESRINIMSNIVSPFVETNRFSVWFVQSPPKYRLVLKITDVSLEDYGNYTCEVRGTFTTVLATLTRYIQVKSPIRSIVLSDQNRTITHTDVQRTLVFNEGDICSLHCVSLGGCPPPQMTLKLGSREITGQFSLDHSSQLSGVKGLRLIEHKTERWTDRFKMTAQHDNQRLQCIVTVPSLGSNISTVKIRVNYAPVMSCESKTAFIGDQNVYIRCEVDARPRVSALFWIVDDKGNTVSEGRIQGDYWTIIMDDSNGSVLDVRLYMKKTTPATYRSYTLVAENVIGTSTQQVALSRKHKASSSRKSSSDPEVSLGSRTKSREEKYNQRDFTSSASPTNRTAGSRSRGLSSAFILLLSVTLTFITLSTKS